VSIFFDLLFLFEEINKLNNTTTTSQQQQQ